MPALITHHLFGEESIDRLPQGVITSDEERIAFILGNQGPDPFFFHILTPRVSDCTLLAQVMHRSRMSRQFACLRDGVSHLLPRDASLGRAFALGLLSHYVLDRNAHPFVYEQQFGIVESDSELENSSSQVHAVIESDLDVLMLQLKRDGATVDDYPPAGEIVTTDRINRVAGVLMSYVAGRVGTLNMILVAVAAYMGIVLFAAFFLKTAFEFWVLAIMVGLFQGGVQALSRSYFGRIIPKEKSNEYYGFFDIFGRYASVMGTFLVSVVTSLTGNPSLGVLSIGVLLIVGFMLLVRLSRMTRAAEHAA